LGIIISAESKYFKHFPGLIGERKIILLRYVTILSFQEN